jgi:hypothetical protein
MLPFRLQQIKEILEAKNESSVLKKEEFELLKELEFLDNDEDIQEQILSNPKRLQLINEILAPPPTVCSACGRPF